MVTVTERAKDHLKKLLVANTADSEMALRLVPTEDGNLSLMMDKEKPGDYIVEQDEVKVLLVDAMLSPHVEGLTMDLNESPEGTFLSVIPTEPQA
ncbi:MAG: hypothetical protein R6U37_09120 [Dehalococcoidia bacterium]